VDRRREARHAPTKRIAPTPKVVVAATTRAVLDLAERQGPIPSAQATWEKLAERAPGADPPAQARIVRPP
jgi:hypothetical protein